MTDRTYFKITDDIDTLYGLDDFNDEEAVHAPTGEIVDDLHTAADDWSGMPNVAAATSEEHGEWDSHYEVLRTGAAAVHKELAIAQAAWEDAQEQARQRLRALYEAYEPVHQEIGRRIEEVHQELEAQHETEAAAARQEAERQQAAEDAELGPRTWVIQRTLDYSRRYSPAKTPVVHLAGCALTHGLEDEQREDETTYARFDDALKLVDDLTEKTTQNIKRLAPSGRWKGTRQPVKLCGRCKPEPSLRAADPGRWTRELEAMESIQPPMPTEKGMPKALDVPWYRWEGRVAGYGVVSRTHYETDKLIEPYEAAIGWVTFEEGRTALASSGHVDKLEELIRELPARGFAARRVKQLRAAQNADSTALSPSLVAVRRLTPHEIRTATSGKA